MQCPEYPDPSMLEIPFVERKGFDPRDIHAVTRERLSRVPYVPFDNRELEPTGRPEAQKKEEMNKDHKALVEDIILHPFSTLDERGIRLGLPPESLAKRMNELLKMGWVRSVEDCYTGKKPFKTTFITEKGAALLGVDYAKSIPPGKGGVGHRWIQHCLNKAVENSVIEFQSGDLVQYDGSRKIVWEIEMNPKEPHALEQIRRNLSDFDRIVMVAKNKEDLKVLREKVKQEFGDNEGIRFVTIGEVLKNVPSA